MKIGARKERNQESDMVLLRDLVRRVKEHPRLAAKWSPISLHVGGLFLTITATELPGGPEPDDQGVMSVYVKYHHNLPSAWWEWVGVSDRGDVYYYAIDPPAGYDPFEEDEYNGL